MHIRLSVFTFVLVKEITEFLERCYACSIRASKYLRTVPLHDLLLPDYAGLRNVQIPLDTEAYGFLCRPTVRR